MLVFVRLENFLPAFRDSDDVVVKMMLVEEEGKVSENIKFYVLIKLWSLVLDSLSGEEELSPRAHLEIICIFPGPKSASAIFVVVFFFS